MVEITFKVTADADRATKILNSLLGNPEVSFDPGTIPFNLTASQSSLGGQAMTPQAPVPQTAVPTQPLPQQVVAQQQMTQQPLPPQAPNPLGQPPATQTPLPVADAPAYTMDQLAVAGTQLMDAGRTQELLGLLGAFGVTALTELPKEQYGNFAMQLRALGARI